MLNVVVDVLAMSHAVNRMIERGCNAGVTTEIGNLLFRITNY